MFKKTVHSRGSNVQCESYQLFHLLVKLHLTIILVFDPKKGQSRYFTMSN